VAQSVKRPTLDLGSGGDLGVVRSSPVAGSVLGMSLLEIFSLSLLLPLPYSPSLKTKQNKKLPTKSIDKYATVLETGLETQADYICLCEYSLVTDVGNKGRRKITKCPYYLQPTGKSLRQAEGPSSRNTAASMLILC